MPEISAPVGSAGNLPVWDQDLVYFALGEPARRRLLLALARGGPKPAGDLTGTSGRRLDATLKHLLWLRKAGLVVQQENPRDGRKLLYAVAANVPLAKTASGAVLDFGFLTVRL